MPDLVKSPSGDANNFKVLQRTQFTQEGNPSYPTGSTWRWMKQVVAAAGFVGRHETWRNRAALGLIQQLS